MTTPATPPLRLDFLRALAAEVRRYRGPNHADARRLVKLIDLHRHLSGQADGPDGQLAEGLAPNLLPAIDAAAARLRL